MAGEKIASEIVAPSKEGQVSGLVLGTTRRVLDVYDLAKTYSPLLRQGLEVVEARVPDEWVASVTKRSEPMLAGLDVRYDKLSQTVTEQWTARVAQVAMVNEQVSTRVIAPVSQTVTGVRARVMAPVTAAVSTRVEQWKDLRGEMTKKGMERLEQGLEGVKVFSATRGKDMIHVDLIEYSRDILDHGVQYSRTVVDNARSTVDPLLVPVTEKVVKAVADVRAAAEDVRMAVAERSARTQEEMTARMHAAKDAALALGQQGMALVQTKYQLLPEKDAVLAMLTARLPVELHGSVQVLLDAPAMFAVRASEVVSKADVSADKKVLENITALLQAVRTVLFAPAPAAVASAPMEVA